MVSPFLLRTRQLIRFLTETPDQQVASVDYQA